VVLDDGFANGCEGATVHGIEMNNISCSMTVIIYKLEKVVLEVLI
jgi:hypothetical protein